MNIDQLVEQYKTVEELKIFVGSQFKQIMALTKKLKELEDKNEELQKKANRPQNLEAVAQINETGNLITPDLKVLNDAKTIAQVQIRKLKEEAFSRELTLEETKKLDIFNKILTEKQEVAKKSENPTKVLNEQELLALVQSSNG